MGLYSVLLRQKRQNPAIFDASDVLANPEAMLKIMCSALSIEWDDRMLFWETGLRTDDGIWAEHWYNQVRQSSGFGRPQKKKMELSTHQHKIADECQPFYAKMEKLKAYYLKNKSSNYDCELI